MVKKWTWRDLLSGDALRYIATHDHHNVHVFVESQYGYTETRNQYYVDRYEVTCATCKDVLYGTTTEGVRVFPQFYESGHG